MLAANLDGEQDRSGSGDTRNRERCFLPRAALQFLTLAGGTIAGGVALPACDHSPSTARFGAGAAPLGKEPSPASRRPWFDLGIVGDPIMDNQVLWHLSQVWSQQADVGEVLDTAHRINAADPWSWPNEWLRAADRLRGVARKAEHARHAISAGETYFRSANYYRAAHIPARLRSPSRAQRAF